MNRFSHRMGIVVMMVAAFWGALLVQAPSAAAESVETAVTNRWGCGIRLGVLAHDVDHLWSRSRAESGIDLNAELVLIQPGWTLFSGSLQPHAGFSLNSCGGTSKVYAGLLWEFDFLRKWFFNTGLGLAVHNGELDTDREDQKSLGSRVLFRVPIEIGVALHARHRISIMFDHVSNAYLADPNQGLDTLGIRYGYRF